MTVEKNKALVRRYMELYNTGDLSIADEVLAADFVDHSHPEMRPGPEDVKRMVAAFRAAFPDACGTDEDLICEGDKAAFRFTLRGTHLHSFAGFTPTGKEIVWTGMDFVRIAEGKIVELWSSQDTLSVMQQLGAVKLLPQTEEG